MATKYVYMFTEGNASMRNLLGGKGAGLAEMTGLGLPVPQGFTITTEACTRYYEDGRRIDDEIMEQIRQLDISNRCPRGTAGPKPKGLILSMFQILRKEVNKQ